MWVMPAGSAHSQPGRAERQPLETIHYFMKGEIMFKKKRKKLSKNGSKKLFKGTVNKMKSKNISRPQRGGGRL